MFLPNKDVPTGGGCFCIRKVFLQKKDVSAEEDVSAEKMFLQRRGVSTEYGGFCRRRMFLQKKQVSVE